VIKNNLSGIPKEIVIDHEEDQNESGYRDLSEMLNDNCNIKKQVINNNASPKLNLGKDSETVMEEKTESFEQSDYQAYLPDGRSYAEFMNSSDDFMDKE